MKKIQKCLFILSVALCFLALLLSGCNGSSAAAGRAGDGALYKNPEASVQERVDDLLARMTLEEKIGQMTQVEKNSINLGDIKTMYIGSILSGGGGCPRPNTPEAWADMVDGFQSQALETRLGIPLIYGVDAVHGHSNVQGAVIFPHNIGLGAAGDSDLVERIGRITAVEMAATGALWNFAPVVAVPQDIRWGRTYEGYSENTDLVSRLGKAYIHGQQNADSSGLGAATTVLATPKHYLADGGTVWGTSQTTVMKKFMIDQGVTQVDEATLRRIHLPPYKAAIEGGAQCIMVSFSSWKDTKMHAHTYLLTDVLKGELGFEGFLISDWKAIDQIPGNYYSDVVTSINAGLDMIMVPYDYVAFIDALTQAVENGDVPMTRIDDAVRRILTVKIKLGLFERPLAVRELLPDVGCEAHRELAREAVRKSLVLLKNNGSTLPLAKDTPLIFVAGQAADDIGIQCGGWTIEWQGKAGAITEGATIVEGIKKLVSGAAAITYDKNGDFRDIANQDGTLITADAGIVVVGELPYAEGVGDQGNLALSAGDVLLIDKMRKRCERVVLIIISGRPLIISDVIGQCDAVVAAWLPGTEGRGVADVLFGDYAFTGKLSFTWPKAMNQIPFDFNSLDEKKVLFPFGYAVE
ncbi:MAG: glycoside hydrolase family 3 C-terminal domain-containing protein [Spirochaetales bacterium]|nr:glycoside hydrolase family 3 C-terminal domain-containing protein [Spirochaetales bacterium]